MSKIKEILDTMDYGPAPEADDQARAWLKAHDGGFGHFIDGHFTTPVSGQTFPVRDPARDETLATVAQGSAEDVDLAVAAARAAFEGWSKTPGHVRARHLYGLARHVQKRERFLSVLESLDNGKPIRESRDIDIPLVARHFYHHAGWAELIASEFPNHAPVGVCGQIIPWNFPLLMLAWKIAPALAAGNTVVLKPAEFTPLTALAFAEICREAGLPRGVVNIVTGDGATGAALARHPGVDKVAFTGSTEVGRLIRQETAGSGKKLSLELGGKSPFMVFEDADLDGAVEGVVDAIWFNQGQVCCAGSRILVQEGVAERFYAKLKRRMGTLRMGDPLDKSTDVGAIVAPVQLQRIRDLVARGQAEGATMFQAGGHQPEGCFFPPTLFTDVEPASTIAQVEIFGPVAVAMTFRTPDEAVALANNTRYGLAASIWSENINLALDAAGKVQAGVVWINSTNLFDAAAGFGGYKESGFGREGGREGLAEYLAPAWLKICRLRPTRRRLGCRPCRPSARRGMPTPARPPSIARRSSTSGASRPGRIRATATRCATRAGRRSDRRASATARTSATPSRRPTRPVPGGPRPPIIAPRCSITWPRTCTPARPSSPIASPRPAPLTNRPPARSRLRSSAPSSTRPGPTSMTARSTRRAPAT